MKTKTIILWGLIGTILVIAESFFLSRSLTLMWTLVFSWKSDNPWWLIFGIGVFTDLMLFATLGKSALIFIAVGLATKYLQTILGFRGNYKIKISNFR